jgi:hypothetical protein
VVEVTIVRYKGEPMTQGRRGDPDVVLRYWLPEPPQSIPDQAINLRHLMVTGEEGTSVGESGNIFEVLLHSAGFSGSVVKLTKNYDTKGNLLGVCQEEPNRLVPFEEVGDGVGVEQKSTTTH